MIRMTLCRYVTSTHMRGANREVRPFCFSLLE